MKMHGGQTSFKVTDHGGAHTLNPTRNGKRLPFKGAALLLIIFLLALVLPASDEVMAKETMISRESTQFLGKLSQSLAEVAEAARPAVVNISTTATKTMDHAPVDDLFNDPFFRHFFGDRIPQHPEHRKPFKSSALGSGVIVSDQGYVLTNNHVVKGADTIKVVLYDKREFAGKVVGVDSRTDLAVVKIEGKDLPTISFGDSGALKIADVVLAIGNPFGLNQTITMGIVSAVGRSNVGIADFEDFIQTDAAINPGNSGGALVNGNGQLVGINTAIFSTSGGYMGIGFAIPSNMVKSIMDSIIKTGKVVRGWMGVTIQELTPELAQSLGFKGTEGALISGVENGSPADKAGFKRGDLVLSLDGTPIDGPASLRNRVSSLAPGTKVQVTVIRDGKEKVIPLTLGEYQEKKAEQKTESNNALNGISVQELTPGIRDGMHLPEEINGVVVANVGLDSPARGVLQPRDVIQEVERTAIRSVEDYEDAVAKIGEKDTVLVLVYRGGGSIYIAISP